MGLPKRVPAPGRKFGALLLPLLIAAGLTHAEVVLPLDVETAVNHAIADNPSLAAETSRAQALRLLPPQAGALPEPRLMLNLVNVPVNSLDTSMEPMTMWEVGVSQMLPFPGKRGLERKTAIFEAEAGLADVAEARLRLARDVRMTWWQLFYLDRALDVVTRNHQLLRQLIEIARSSYKVGEGMLQDVLMAELERSRLLEAETMFKSERTGMAAQMNALLNREPDSQLILAPESEQPLPDLPDLKSLVQIAREQRAMLQAREHMVEAAESRLSLARKAYYPDFELAASYGLRESRDDMGSLLFSMNLPLRTGSRQDPQREQRQLELQQQRNALMASRTQVETEIAQSVADYQRAREQAVIYRTAILPQTQQTVAALRSAYEVNKVDFMNLVRAQISLLDDETRYWKIYSQAQQVLAQLAAAAGKEHVNEVLK